jgi:hypothetical protein
MDKIRNADQATLPCGPVAGVKSGGSKNRTGVVVVVFAQIYPETKKRQYKRVLDAYEAAGGQARASKPRPGWVPGKAARGRQNDARAARMTPGALRLRPGSVHAGG